MPMTTVAATTTTVAATTTTAQAGPDTNFPPAAQRIALSVGQAGMTIGGVSVPITNSSHTTGAGFTLTGGGLVVDAVPPSRGFSPGEHSAVTLSGLSAESKISVFLMSEPTSLGTFVVGNDGATRATVKIPASIRAGVHTLQFTGWTRSKLPFILSVSISLKPRVRTLRASVSFYRSTVDLDRAGQSAFLQLATRSLSLAGPTRIVINYSGSGKWEQVELDKRRAQEIVNFLRRSGTKGTIRIRELSAPASRSLEPRTLSVTATG